MKKKSSVLIHFFALKAKLQVVKLELNSQIKFEYNHKPCRRVV